MPYDEGTSCLYIVVFAFFFLLVLYLCPVFLQFSFIHYETYVKPETEVSICCGTLYTFVYTPSF